MKYLAKVPFIRIWANLFIFKGKENREDYTIDFLLWLVIALPLLIVAIVLHYKIINTNYEKFDILSFCIICSSNDFGCFSFVHAVKTTHARNTNSMERIFFILFSVF